MEDINVFAKSEPKPLNEAQKLYKIVQQRPEWQNGKIVNPFLAGLRDNPVFVTYGLLAVIVAIFVLETLAGGSTNNAVLIRFGAKFGPAILDGEVWRLFTSMFLHIGIAHLLFNGFGLYSLGRDMERMYGVGRFIAIYLLSGLFGSLASFAMRGAEEFSAGASGALFGLLGMSLAFFFFHRKRLGKKGQAQMRQILQIVGINLVLGFSIAQINNLAHIGGLIAGTIFGYLLAPRHIVVTDDGRQEAALVDTAALTRRWWVVLFGAVLFAAGTWLALDFHGANFIPTDFI